MDSWVGTNVQTLFYFVWKLKLIVYGAYWTKESVKRKWNLSVSILKNGRKIVWFYCCWENFGGKNCLNAMFSLINPFDPMWATGGSRYVLVRETIQEPIISLFFSHNRIMVSPSFIQFWTMLQSFHYTEECFSLKQSRQKNLSQSGQKVFILFAAIALASLDSCFLIFS